MVSAYALSTGLQSMSGQNKVQQVVKNNSALTDARAALLAYASQQMLTAAYTASPGALPCPDTNNDGIAESTCNTAASRVGRFPWQTIGAGKLVDWSGEVLWYGISDTFRPTAGSFPINSDTVGNLSITNGASRLVAVIVAPGISVAGQSRTTATVNTLSAYLELSNAGTSGTYVGGTASDTFNDQVLGIAETEYLAVIESAVAARLTDLKSQFTSHLAFWGALPYPAPFNDAPFDTSGPGINTSRPQNSYYGVVNKTEGLLPLASTYADFSWKSPTVTVTNVAGTNSITITSCPQPSSGSQLNCRFRVLATNCPVNGSTRICVGTVSVAVNVGQAPAAGITFPKTMTTSDVTQNINAGASSNFSINGDISSAGLGVVTYQFNYSTTCTSGTCQSSTMRVQIPVLTTNPQLTTLTSGGVATAGSWLIANEWYRNIYYTVSSGAIPSGANNCTTGTTCLTAIGSNTTVSNGLAFLIVTGRSLVGATRPNTNLSDYLEGMNADKTNFAVKYESAATGVNAQSCNKFTLAFPTQTCPTTTNAAYGINDRIAVMAP